MDLIISRTAATAAADLEGLKAFLPDFGAKGLGYLLEYGTHARIGTTPETAGNLYLPRKAATFSRVAIGRSLRQFMCPWSEACIAYANTLVGDGGSLVLPVTDTRSGEWTLDPLIAFVGAQPGRKSGFLRRVQYGEFARPVALRPRPSVFSWFMQNAGAIYRVYLDNALKDDPGVADCLPVLDEIMADSEARDVIPQQLQTAMSLQAYYVGGIGYKGANLRFIHDKVSGSAPWRRYVDVGGGYGLLAAEASLDRDMGVEEALTVDISSLNEAYFQVFRSAPGSTLAAKTAFALSDVASFDFATPADALSFVGSFLYVPQPNRKAILKRAFDSLRPGGVLVIHENIKAPSYTTDYALMFEPEEIEGLMREHGRIRYFSSTSMEELDHAKVERKAVFRVVQKS